jgi:hypothetical protein
VTKTKKILNTHHGARTTTTRLRGLSSTDLDKLCVYTTELDARSMAPSSVPRRRHDIWLCQRSMYFGAIAYDVELCYLGAIGYVPSKGSKNNIKFF